MTLDELAAMMFDKYERERERVINYEDEDDGDDTSVGRPSKPGRLERRFAQLHVGEQMGFRAAARLCIAEIDRLAKEVDALKRAAENDIAKAARKRKPR